MSNLLIVETNKIGSGYALANDCCLNLRNTLVEGFPISSQRFVFILKGQDLDKAKELIKQDSKNTAFETIDSPHTDLLKVLFNLKAPISKSSLGFFSFSNFPIMVSALNTLLDRNIEIIESRYGRVIQDGNFILVSGEWDRLVEVEGLLKSVIIESKLIKELSTTLKELL